MFYEHVRPAALRLMILFFFGVVTLHAPQQSIAMENMSVAKLTLNLQQALKMTLDSNPELELFQYQFKELEGAMTTASVKPSYQLGVELENFSGNGEYSGLDNSELTVSLSSAIELGGKLDARQQVVTANNDYLGTQKRLKTLELLSETTKRYLEVLAAQERIKLAEESVQIAQKAITIVKRRVKLGASMTAEASRAEASLAQAELTLNKEQSNYRAAQVNLASMWGELDVSSFAVQGNLYQFGKSRSLEQLLTEIQNNPSIRQYAALERIRDAELDLVRSNNQSDLNWSVGVVRNEASGDIGLKAGFSMELFTESRNQGAYQRAQAAKEQTFVSKRTALLRLQTQLAKTYQYREQSIKTTQRLEQDIIPALLSALSDSEEAYKRGRYSYFEYVLARQELIAAKRKLIDEAVAVLLFGVTIEQLIAQPLTQPAVEL
ncbi:TolC family protein [Kangiella aquimarina]|uniref:TolC family protein n=2 Tax=Kangiella aquimarina TaxID=261965 RepID=A0ABZ0X262_9GAMM|nr:TolC family protein [Kangiella aquimarina]WQG84468.1 TolC family protein [Kangiella aquimarina]